MPKKASVNNASKEVLERADSKTTKEVSNETVEAGFNEDTFLAELEKNVSPTANEEIPNEEVPQTEETVSEEVPAEETAEVEKPSEDVELDDEDLSYIQEKYGLVQKERYSESSSEAKRLKAQLKDQEEFASIGKLVADDEKLQEVLFNYSRGGKTPEATQNELKLPEDFIFDGDEAIRNPDSLSGKLLVSMVDKRAEQIADQKLNATFKKKEQDSAKAAQAADEARFRKENNLTQDQFDDFLSWAKETPYTLDFLYSNYNRKDRENKIAKSSTLDKIKQMKKMRETPTSMASKGEPGTEEISHDDEVFGRIQAHVPNAAKWLSGNVR